MNGLIEKTPHACLKSSCTLPVTGADTVAINAPLTCQRHNEFTAKGAGGTTRHIDINAGTVTVTMAEGATMTEAQASRIVEDAGFTLGGFEEVRAQASTKPE